MDKVYFFVSQLDDFVNDGWEFYSRYFINEGGFLSSFLIALIVAVALLIIFYGVICNKVFKLSKPIVWLVFLCLSPGITFFITSSFIIGNNDESKDDYTGFYESIEKSYGEKTADAEVNAEEIRAEADRIIEQVSEGEDDVATFLCTGNAIFSLIWFLLFSVLVKGFTKYGIAIPFVWPRKLHKSI